MVVESTGPILFASISTNNADVDLVAAVADKKIRVLSLFIVVTSDNGTIKFQSNASTDLSGAMPFNAKGQLPMPHNPCGWLETAKGEKLNMDVTNTGQVSGFMTYQLVG